MSSSSRRSYGRRLEVVVSRAAGLWPAIAAASLVPAASASGCGSEVTAEGASTVTGSGGGVAGAGGSVGGQAGAGALGGSTGTGGSGGATPITCPWGEATFVVPIPPEGVAADTDAICDASEPVESHGAGRISLTLYSQALELATGMLAIEPGLAVVDTPTIDIVEAGYGQLTAGEITNVVPSANGFTFHVQWPSPLGVSPDEWTSMTMQATLSVACTDGTTRLVQARTNLNLCIEQGRAVWISSGDECTTCSQVCEMAPGPTLPHASRGIRALRRAVKLALVPLARVGRSVIVLAEHDAGPGLRYRWQVGGGRLERLAADVVHWTLPDALRDRHLRVAVLGADGVGVASLRIS